MKFGELFGYSWSEYKYNFRIFAIIFLIFAAIPALLNYIVSIPIGLEYYKAGTGHIDTLANIVRSKYFFLSITTTIITVILNLFMAASLTYNSIYRKRFMGVKETLIGGKKYFWKYLLFSIVYTIFIMGLFILLIIPGIIFIIYWIFGPFVLVGTNKGILDSLKESHIIVKGNWWRVLKLLFLFGLVGLLISIGFYIVGGLINLSMKIPFLLDAIKESGFLAAFAIQTIPPSILVISEIIHRIFQLGAQLILTPLGILFAKNLFLDMRKEKVRDYQAKQISRR